MTHKVLILNPQMRLLMPLYQHLFDEAGVETVIHHTEQNVGEDELLDLISGIDGVIAGGDGFTERVLAGADRLKVISKWGVGVDTSTSRPPSDTGSRSSGAPVRSPNRWPTLPSVTC